MDLDFESITSDEEDEDPADAAATTAKTSPPSHPDMVPPPRPSAPFFMQRPAMLAMPPAPAPSPSAAADASPVPPALIGPMAGRFQEPPAAAEPEPVAPKPPVEDAVPPGFEPHDVPIAKYGSVSAELMIRRGERARVLADHKLNEPTWARVHAYWTAEMGRETARGEGKLLAQFDSAYVDTMGRLRTPIGVPEYASILVAIERGAVEKQLAQLALSLSDLMRVQRVWTRKIAEDPEVGRVLGKAIEEVRTKGSA